MCGSLQASLRRWTLSIQTAPIGLPRREHCLTIPWVQCSDLIMYCNDSAAAISGGHEKMPQHTRRTAFVSQSFSSKVVRCLGPSLWPSCWSSSDLERFSLRTSCSATVGRLKVTMSSRRSFVNGLITCSRVHMLRTLFGVSRSNTSGSRIAGNESVPRITGRNIGMLCEDKKEKSVSKFRQIQHFQYQFLLFWAHWITTKAREYQFKKTHLVWMEVRCSGCHCSDTFLKVSVVGSQLYLYVGLKARALARERRRKTLQEFSV